MMRRKHKEPPDFEIYGKAFKRMYRMEAIDSFLYKWARPLSKLLTWLRRRIRR